MYTVTVLVIIISEFYLVSTSNKTQHQCHILLAGNSTWYSKRISKFSNNNLRQPLFHIRIITIFLDDDFSISGLFDAFHSPRTIFLQCLYCSVSPSVGSVCVNNLTCSLNFCLLTYIHEDDLGTIMSKSQHDSFIESPQTQTLAQQISHILEMIGA